VTIGGSGEGGRSVGGGGRIKTVEDALLLERAMDLRDWRPSDGGIQAAAREQKESRGVRGKTREILSTSIKRERNGEKLNSS